MLRKQVRMDAEEFDKALEKLWIHGGALVDFAENVARGHDRWRESYIAQGDQKQQQLDLMLRYAESSECRMASLVRHFGDIADSQKACGICDFCAPSDCCGQRFRPATGGGERAWPRRWLKRCARARDAPPGNCMPRFVPRGEMTRDEFEELLGAHGARQFPADRQYRFREGRQVDPVPQSGADPRWGGRGRHRGR